jgi:hypothetical protein
MEKGDFYACISTFRPSIEAENLCVKMFCEKFL